MDKEALRIKGIQDSNQYSSKSRFGLFSHAVSTAVGDNGQYISDLHPRQSDGKGKAITKPKNIQSGTYRNGKIHEPYFNSLNPLVGLKIKDQYIEEGKRLILQNNKKFRKGTIHNSNFIPASDNKILCKAAYEHMEDRKSIPNINRKRQQDGRVTTQLSNIYTNTSKNIQNKYFKKQRYISDAYDRQNKLNLQKRKKNCEGSNIFRPNSFVPKQFQKNILVYGQDRQIKKKIKKQQKISKSYHHDEGWKGTNESKKGIYGYFSKFPQYKENPPNQIKRNKQQVKKEGFKSMSSTKLSKPSPSISLNHININKYNLHLR